MIVNRGHNTDTTSGNRQIIFCEGTSESIDEIFYKTLLGIDATKFELKPLGSSNTLFCYAETKLIENGFCLMDRDFRTDEEITELEKKYKIRFLRVHEVENFLLNQKYLNKLDYIKQDIDIEDIIKETIKENKNRLLADYLQHKINNYLNGTDYKFPRIGQLKNNEILEEDKIIEKLLSKLDTNYKKIEIKVNEIKENHIDVWKKDFDNLPTDLLPGKEIFQKIKNKIFSTFFSESDIAKDIATLMMEDGYLPNELQTIFNTQQNLGKEQVKTAEISDF